MFGSLDDFIDTSISANHSKFFKNDQDQPIDKVEKFTKRRLVHWRKKRALSEIESYKATDKSLLFEKFATNFPQMALNDKKSRKTQDKPFFTSRKQISQSRISSLFYGQNPMKMKDEISKEHLKREHNLLRAIVRTKLQQQQKISNTQYEDSFNRMIHGFKNIRIKPVVDDQIIETQEEKPKTNRNLNVEVHRKAKSQLSNKTRLQFESCLNWTKKRKKDGSFYAVKLGKNSQVRRDSLNIEDRKQILSYLRERSGSIGL